MTQEQIFQLICIILPFILTTIGVPLIKHLLNHLPVAQQATAEKFVTSAVNAVEQLATTNTQGLTPLNKKTLAMQFVTTALKKVGFTIDPQVLSQLIEAAVYALNQTQASTISAATVETTTSLADTPTVASPALGAFSYDTGQVSSQTGVIPAVSAQ
jgi:hypothetical protein